MFQDLKAQVEKLLTERMKLQSKLDQVVQQNGANVNKGNEDLAVRNEVSCIVQCRVLLLFYRPFDNLHCLTPWNMCSVRI